MMLHYEVLSDFYVYTTIQIDLNKPVEAQTTPATLFEKQVKLKNQLTQVSNLSSSLSVRGSNRVKPDNDRKKPLRFRSRENRSMQNKSKTTPISPRTLMREGPSFKSPQKKNLEQSANPADVSDDDNKQENGQRSEGLAGWVSERKAIENKQESIEK